MQNDRITKRQATCMLILFLFGSSGILGGSSESEQDSWIAIIIATVVSMPVVIMYARIIHLFPEQDFFSVVENIFGKIFGKILIAVFSLYSLELGSLVLRNFSEFLKISIMTETPQLPLMIVMIAITAYLTVSGVRVFGKWSIVNFILILFSLILVTLMSVTHFHYSNLLPVFNHDIKNLLTSSMGFFSFPLCETVVLLAVSSSIRKEDSPYKIYVLGIILGALILLVLFFRNTFVLGAYMKETYFPSYVAVRMISLGKIITRLEGTIMINYLLGGITKITICLFAATKGSAKLFNIKNYKKTIIPICVLTVLLSYFLFSNTIQMINHIKIYPYYAIPVQVVIPLIIWIGAEIKSRKQKQYGEDFDY